MNRLNLRETLREQMRCVLRDSYAGFMSFTHNGLALVGLTALLVTTLLMTQPELRSVVQKLVTLQSRDQQRVEDNAADSNRINELVEAARQYAAQTTTLLGLNEDSETPEAALALSEIKAPPLTGQQKNVARYLATKYRVSQTAIELLVIAAHETGKETAMEPSLLLAVMAVESGFNPFAQSSAGAQGLMQVMSKVHADKLDDFGGSNAALNPVANLQVGALILKDCIRRGGSVSAGLRLYVGAGMNDDAGYGDKVLLEKQRIDIVARSTTLPLPGSVTASTRIAVPAKSQPTVELAPHAEINPEPQAS